MFGGEAAGVPFRIKKQGFEDRPSFRKRETSVNFKEREILCLKELTSEDPG